MVGLKTCYTRSLQPHDDHRTRKEFIAMSPAGLGFAPRSKSFAVRKIRNNYFFLGRMRSLPPM